MGAVGGIVSSVGSMFGAGGGAGGTGFAAPAQAQITDAATAKQAEDLYKNNQSALQNQQNFVNQVMPFGTTGLQNQQQALQGYQDIYAGRGPDLAQTQLQQATQQNIANQAALMAGQRGASQNTGLLARQAAMQGANTQQQAAGQAAQLRAQQQVNALQGMGGLATQQVNQAGNAQQAYTGAAQNEQQNILNSIAQANSARAGVQTSINQSNASMAGTRMGQQGNLLGGLMGGAASALALAKGGEVPHYANGAVVSGSGQYDPSFTGMSDDQWNAMKSGAPQVPVVPQIAPSPIVPPAAPTAPAPAVSKPAPGKFSQFLKSSLSPDSGQSSDLYKGASALGQGLGSAIKGLFSKDTSDEDTKQAYLDANDKLGTADPNNIMKGAPGFNKEVDMSASNEASPFMAAHGGKVPAMVSPGEGYLDRKAVKQVEKGANPLKEAEIIPGKPKIKGAVDTEKNDTVPKDLDEGGIVLPRSVMEAKHPHWEAHKFVSQIMAKNGKLPPRKKNG